MINTELGATYSRATTTTVTETSNLDGTQAISTGVYDANEPFDATDGTMEFYEQELFIRVYSIFFRNIECCSCVNGEKMVTISYSIHITIVLKFHNPIQKLQLVQ